ncbi:MAG: sulfur carrier protein ThiS adenylyltransferase ThiF [Kiritimatiellales bacterium]
MKTKLTKTEWDAVLIERHGAAVHEKLKAATAGIAGLGGLGSAVAVALTRSGIGKLILGDFDRVEPSNLNRQHYFMDQLGELKTDALAANLRRINPYLTLELYAEKIMPENVSPIFSGVDVMIEAFDRADQKAMLLQEFTAQCAGIPFIGASGMAGCGAGETIGVKKLSANVYIVGDLKTGLSPEHGLMAPRVGIAAHMQANLALQIILGQV